MLTLPKIPERRETKSYPRISKMKKSHSASDVKGNTFKPVYSELSDNVLSYNKLLDRKLDRRIALFEKQSNVEVNQILRKQKHLEARCRQRKISSESISSSPPAYEACFTPTPPSGNSPRPSPRSELPRRAIVRKLSLQVPLLDRPKVERRVHSFTSGTRPDHEINSRVGDSPSSDTPSIKRKPMLPLIEDDKVLESGSVVFQTEDVILVEDNEEEVLLPRRVRSTTM